MSSPVTLLEELDQRDILEIGRELHGFAELLYPICRSITGSGIRATLAMIQEQIPLRIHEVASGTQVFDWKVPKEWNIRDAWIKSPDGTRIVDFNRCNLHVMSYSVPVRARLSLEEIRPHLFTIPERPDWIPYRTSYYQENWGFCLSHNQMMGLEDGEYEVCVDSTLEDGKLTYGECYLPGRSQEEILISCHACHPSLADDNLSGLAVATFLARLLRGRSLHHSFRFLFIPGTIGAISWLALNRDAASRVRAGLVLTCVGDSAGFHYKRSRHGNAEIDRAVACVLRDAGGQHEMLDFSPVGYDERQYCSPGFNLPVGCLMRSVWGTFPEYHTSADDLTFIRPDAMAGSLKVCAAICDVLENNRRYVSRNPFCEPQLGKRGLYGGVGGRPAGELVNALLWVMNLADGEHSLLEIAERSRLPFSHLHAAARRLLENGLLEEIAPAAA